MATSQVPKLKFTPEGLKLPQESEILSGVQSDINSAFGGGVNPALDTPQGQIASSTTAIIGDKNSEFAYFVNQVDPAFSSGRMQDAIGRIYFLSRKPGTATTVQAVCMGAAGVVITAGSRARSQDGVMFICQQTGTIPQSGSITLTFSAQELGPIPLPENTLTEIVTAIPGWDRINNPSAGVTGTHVESRADFEYRRQNSVALNAHGSLESIYASVFNLPGVTDVYATENVKDTTETFGPTNFSLAPHSLYVAVVGGDSYEIANTIWKKKDTGCNYNGNTSTYIEDMNYDYPRPSYEVKFQRPDSLPIKFEIKIVNSPSLPSDIIHQTKDAIVAAFSGADGGQRARIGGSIFASRYYGPVSMIGPSVSIISILVGTVTADQNQVEVGIDQAPTISESDITVTLV